MTISRMSWSDGAYGGAPVRSACFLGPLVVREQAERITWVDFIIFLLDSTYSLRTSASLIITSIRLIVRISLSEQRWMGFFTTYRCRKE